MNASGQERLKELFLAALERPPEERGQFLDGACGSDAQVRREIESLLASHAQAGEYLRVPIIERLALAAALPAGHQVGAYRIAGVLGHGGMSTVYLATRADDLYRGQVALKVLHRRVSGAESRAAFVREAQVLASLSHPNIVRLLDAGETGGFSCLVMEHVEGVPLDTYCRERQLERRAIIHLFLKVADAVIYAHRNLVVHRDLKPANILVTAGGNVKLLDFGLAKLLEGPLAAKLTLTGYWPMTLHYASPEQVRGERNLSTATDVYSLGVVLYELLTGQSPYQDESDLSPEALLRAVVEGEPVPPRRRRPDLPAELECVILKALEKAPENRYRSVDALAQDLRRHLAGYPLTARPHTAWYIARKFARRHRFGLAASLVLLLSLVGGLATSIHYARNARRNLEYALQLSAQLIEQMGGDHSTHQRMIARTVELASGALASLGTINPTNAELLRTVMTLLQKAAIAQGYPTSQHVGDTGAAIRTIREAVRIADELWGKDGFSRNLSPVTYATIHQVLGTLLIEADRYPEAAHHFELARKVNENVDRSDPEFRSRRVAYARALGYVSRIYLHERNAAECLRLRKEAVAIFRELSVDSSTDYDLIGHLALYGWALREFGYYDEALEAYYESNRRLQPQISGGPWQADWRALLARNTEQIGRTLAAMGRRKEGLAALREAAGQFREIQRREPESAGNRRSLGFCLGALAEVEAELAPARARQSAAEALSILQAEAQSDPVNVKLRQDLGAMMAKLAGVLGGL